MPTSTADIVRAIEKIKEVLGAVGVVGDLVAGFAKLPSQYAIPLGIVGALFILLWGAFERKNPSNFLKTLAWVGIAVGIVCFIFFAAVGSVLLLNEPPSPFGRVTVEEAAEFRLTSSQPTNRLTGAYPLKFQHEADVVEVVILPAAEDLNKVKELDITTEGPLDQTNRMTLVLNKTSDTQTYYRVTGPTSGFNVKLKATVDINGSPMQALALRVYYKYGKRDLVWKVTSWIFEHFGQ